MAAGKARDDLYDLFKRAVTGFILGISFYFVFFHLPPLCFSIALAGILGIILISEWPRLFHTKTTPFWALMPFYPIFSFISMILLNQSMIHRDLIVIVFILVFAFDFGSYAAGSLFGKHKLAPEISPRKSWEGAIGGYFLSFIFLNIILYVTGAPMSIFMRFYLTFALCSLALCGDFFESLLKRRAGIKDSGSLLPGHGGFLDRFDGLMFVLPLVYLFRDFFARMFGLI